MLIEAKGKIAFIERDLIYEDNGSDEAIAKAIQEACMFGGYTTWAHYYENNTSSHGLGEERLKVQYTLERAVFLGMVDIFGFDAIEAWI